MIINKTKVDVHVGVSVLHTIFSSDKENNNEGTTQPVTLINSNQARAKRLGAKSFCFMTLFGKISFRKI